MSDSQKIKDLHKCTSISADEIAVSGDVAEHMSVGNSLATKHQTPFCRLVESVNGRSRIERATEVDEGINPHNRWLEWEPVKTQNEPTEAGTVIEFEVPNIGANTISMPAGCILLDAQMHGATGGLRMLALVNEQEEEKENRIIEVFGVGEKMIDSCNTRFITSVQAGGEFYCVFERLQ